MRVRALLFAILTFAPAALLAQGDASRFAGRRVSAVSVAIERAATTDATLTELIETRVGEPLSVAEVRETIAHLFSLGRFQDVQVEAIDAADGTVALRYTLIPIHAVERVEFEGSLGLSEGFLRDRLQERFGRTPQLGRAAEATRMLERLYQDHGYFNPTIRVESVEFHDPDRTVLTFRIDSGPQARIRTIEIEGDPQTTRNDLLSRLGLVSGRVYERVRLDDRLTDYVNRLKKRGHLQAAASHTPRVSPDGTAVDLTLDVRAGPMVTVAFQGDLIPEARRDELAPFQREGSVDEDLIEDSIQRIRQYLREQGYWRGDVTWEPKQTDTTLTVVFTVRKGPLFRVAPEGVQVTGNKSIGIEEIRPLIVPAPGVPFMASHMDAARGAIEGLYRTRGFAWVAVKTAETELGPDATGAALVRPSVVIVEGPRAILGDVTISGTKLLGEAEVRQVMQLKPGTPYFEPMLRAARDAVELEYVNLGFASAQVTLAPAVSEDRSRVDVAVTIAEGPQTIVDHIIIVGNQNTAEEVIRREVVLRPGAPLGLRDLLESRRRLSALGLFRRIDIRELESGPPERRDVLVTVEEAPATTVGYGGGLEITRRLRAAGPGGEAEERIELAPRGFFDIGRRNLGGKNRMVNLFTRVSLRPTDSADPAEDGQGVELSEYRLVGTYREPRALKWNADFTLSGGIEQGIRSAFNFQRKGVTAELLRRVTPALRTSVRYAFGTTETFDERLNLQEQSLIDRLFPQVRLSIVTGAVAMDRRNDLVEPTTGTFLSAEASMASRATGGQVGFIRTYLQGLWFRPLVGTSRVVLATRASLGLADGFEREVPATDADGRPIEGELEIIEDLPASERFFAGGDTTIRGFALDTVGAPETISPRGFPRGGNAVLIMNAELRLAVWKDFGAVAFVDGGNVFERATQFDIGELRGSVGFGVRYRSPIGPIRLDLGFKMDQRPSEDRRHVLHFSIGQAF